MIERGNVAKLITNSVFAEIVRQLKYKASWYKKKLIQVSEYYASSQLCSRCGHKNTSIKDLKIRKYKCPKCESILDRDINASINIEYEGVLMYYKELLNA